MTLDQTLGEFFKYIVVGIFNTIIGLGIIFFCMYYLEVTPFISNAFGYAIEYQYPVAKNKQATPQPTRWAVGMA